MDSRFRFECLGVVMDAHFRGHVAVSPVVGRVRGPGPAEVPEVVIVLKGDQVHEGGEDGLALAEDLGSGLVQCPDYEEVREEVDGKEGTTTFR